MYGLEQFYPVYLQKGRYIIFKYSCHKGASSNVAANTKLRDLKSLYGVLVIAQKLEAAVILLSAIDHMQKTKPSFGRMN